MAEEYDSSGDSADSIFYPSDDELSHTERKILKIKRHRMRAFAEQFKDDVPLKASQIIPRLENEKENYQKEKRNVQVRRKRPQTPRVVLQPRKSARLDNKRPSYVGLDDDQPEPSLYRRRSGERRYAPRTRTPRIRQVEFNPDALTGEIAYGPIKTYSSNGTTCHQCRQKTIDLKSQCYSPTCTGVRGQFCGYCLMGRYGEDVAVVLRDRDWTCPPCRSICNCSICRRVHGKPPTGVMKNLASEKGYKSVSHYLLDIGDAVLGDEGSEDYDGLMIDKNPDDREDELLQEQCRSNQPYVKLERLQTVPASH